MGFIRTRLVLTKRDVKCADSVFREEYPETENALKILEKTIKTLVPFRKVVRLTVWRKK